MVINKVSDADRIREYNVYPSLIDELRNLISKYLEESLILCQVNTVKLSSNELISSLGKGLVDGGGTWVPGVIAVVDGGSNVLSLNIGYIGVAVAVGIVINNDEVVSRVYRGPIVIPEDPRELYKYDDLESFHYLIDIVRESLVLNAAYDLLNMYRPDLLVIDGPLTPYGALGRYSQLNNRKFFTIYRESLRKLAEVSKTLNAPVIGVVKRPKSKYIAARYGCSTFDHVILSQVLNVGEYLPAPPTKLADELGYVHDPLISELIREVDVSYTYVRFSKTSPPYRIDFINVSRYEDVLSYLFSIRMHDGLPAVIKKADEEAKIRRELIHGLYNDALHGLIVKYVRGRPDLLIPLLPEYGEGL